jgi:hypothetical protein
MKTKVLLFLLLSSFSYADCERDYNSAIHYVRYLKWISAASVTGSSVANAWLWNESPFYKSFLTTWAAGSGLYFGAAAASEESFTKVRHLIREIKHNYSKSKLEALYESIRVDDDRFTLDVMINVLKNANHYELLCSNSLYPWSYRKVRNKLNDKSLWREVYQKEVEEGLHPRRPPALQRIPTDPYNLEAVRELSETMNDD